MIDPKSPDFQNTPAHPGRPSYHYRPRFPVVAPEISIVTPFHDTGTIFHETARSVLKQSFQAWEWIIVNDASTTPESLTILHQYRHRDPRIRVVDHADNKGVSGARNTGFRLAKSEYVYLIDDDDLIEPTAVETCAWHLASYPEFAFANGWSVGFGAQEYLWPRGFDGREQFLDANHVTGRALVRHSAHARTGGYDESIRHGLEDWEFWLRCAHNGLWGSTIPEYLDWYRRRRDHVDRWADWDGARRIEEFRNGLRVKYARLSSGAFPLIERRPASPYEVPPIEPPFSNRLEKPVGIQRILMIVPWLVMGGSDKFNLDMIGQLSSRGYEITICTTLPSENPWLAEFARITPDIFNLPTFLRQTDYPRFLLYLIDSRQIDVVFISNSYLGYQLLPFLRSQRPLVAYVDFVHMEEDYWKSGGYPRAAVGHHELLDLTVACTEHLKRWMVARGSEPERVEVVRINVDTERWDPDTVALDSVRSSLNIPPDTVLVLYAGRICEQKQPRVFAEVIRRLAHEEHVEFRCVVAGDGPDLPELKQFVADHGLERCVSFEGAVRSERMRELQAAADILFLPSQHEGLAAAIYEAMAMKTVPLAADVGGQAELVTPDCGILVRSGKGEVERYVEALRRLIASPSERAAMAAAGRRRVVEHFSLDQTATRMLDVLNRAEKLLLTDPRPTVPPGLGRESATLALEYTRLEREAHDVWLHNSSLAARLELVTRQLHEHPAVPAQAAEGEEVKRLSAEQISRHIGSRKLFKSLCFRIAGSLGWVWLVRWRGLGRKLLGRT
jgi:glycosyltransferase involved in cell wall biosynthesis